MRSLYLVTIKILAFVLGATAVHAADKSGSSSNVIKLPSAGGTIQVDKSSFSVQTNKGSASYRLPLPELPQRAGFGPQLNFSYSQFAGDSGQGFGVGWSLNLSSIETKGDDGLPFPGEHPISGELLFPVMLDGQELIYQASRSEPGRVAYVPRADSYFQRVTYYNQPYELAHGRPVSGTSPHIKRGFEVVMPNGAIRLYEGDLSVAEGNGDLTTRYVLTYEVSPQGESVRYDYIKNKGRSYLKDIYFAGGKSRFAFTLQEQPAPMISYAKGFRQENRLLYTHLSATFAGDSHAQWCFVHDLPNGGRLVHPACSQEAAIRYPLNNQASLNALSQLRGLMRFGTGTTIPVAKDRINDMEFSYTTWEKGQLANRQLDYPLGNLGTGLNFDSRDFELSDVNKDGIVDIMKNDNGKLRVFYGSGKLDKLISNQEEWLLTRQEGFGTQEVSPNPLRDNIHYADVNGDSYMDVIEFTNDGKAHIYLGTAGKGYEWTGAAVDMTPFMGVEGSLGAGRFTGGRAMFVDVNQDGKADVLTTDRVNDQVVWKVFLNLSDRVGGQWLIRFYPLTMKTPFFMTDTIQLDSPLRKIMDINGDRLPDLIQRIDVSPTKSGLCVYLNSGSFDFTRIEQQYLFGQAAAIDPECEGGGSFVTLSGLSRQATLSSLWILDSNGDGISDFVNISPENPTQLQVWLGTGNIKAYSSPILLNLSRPIALNGEAAKVQSRVGDIDGDGQPELLIFRANVPDAEKVTVIDFNRNVDNQLIKPNLLQKVQVDDGSVYELRYATSTDEWLRNDGITSMPIQFPVVVAKQVVTYEFDQDGKPTDLDVEEYYYHQPFYDAENKRFVGFSRVDRLAYGDEYLGDQTTQESLLSEEIFLTGGDRPGDLELAGYPQSKKIYSVQANSVLNEWAEAFAKLTPNNDLLSSLSKYSQTRQLPEKVSNRNALQETTWVWEAAPVEEGVLAYLLRKTAEQMTSYDTDQSQNEAHERSESFEYDVYGFVTKATTFIKQIGSPWAQLFLPSVKQETVATYDTARAQLAGLRILDRPDSVAQKINEEVVSQMALAYDSNNGQMSEQRTTRVSTAPRPSAFKPEVNERLTAMTYDSYGNIQTVSDGLGLRERISYDVDGIFALEHRRISGASGPDLLTRVFYDGPRRGMVHRFINPIGLENRFQYDNLGRKIRLTSNDGGEEIYSYRNASMGKPTMILTQSRRYADTAVVPPGENRWVMSLVAVRPDGSLLAEAEDAESALYADASQCLVNPPAATGSSVRISATSRNNRKKQPVFVSSPYLATGPLDYSVASIFADGKVPGHQSGALVGVWSRYDELGRLTGRSLPSGLEEVVSYAPWGMQLKLYKDKAGKGAENPIYTRSELRHEMGVYALVESGVNPDGSEGSQITQVDRDLLGTMKSLLLPGEKNERSFVYNNFGQLEYEKIPAMGERFYRYDARGRMVEELRTGTSEQHLVSTEYDNLDRKIFVRENGQLRYAYRYDTYPTFKTQPAYAAANPTPVGLLTEIRNYDPNHNYDSVEGIHYDPAGNVIHREVTLGDTTYKESWSLTLDDVAVRYQDHMGLESVYSLGRDQRLKSVSVRGAFLPQQEQIMRRIVYNAKGQLARVDYKSCAVNVLTYDDKTLYLNRIESSYQDGNRQVPLQDLMMTYDPRGSVQKIDDLITEATPYGHIDRSGVFGYNWKDELVTASRYGETERFDYLPSGSFSSNNGALGFVPSTETSLIPRSPSNKAYRFDEFGQLDSSDRVKSTVFDGFGRMIQSETATDKVEYGYDSEGHRLYKLIKPKNGSAAKASLFPLKTLNIEDNKPESFVFVGEQRLARFEHKSKKWFFYLKDHLGSSDIMMNTNGKPVEQMLYRSYGTEVDPRVKSALWDGYLNTNAQLLPEEKTHHRYTGQYLDDDTGLYYYGARYYDPVLGRFISPDDTFIESPELCLKNSIECNLYSYSRNNPMKYSDPTGKIAWIPVILGAIWVADKAYTAYEGYKEYKAVQAGEKTWGDVAKDKAIETGVSLAVGALGRGALKGGKILYKVVSKEVAPAAGKVVTKVAKEGLEEGAGKIAKAVKPCGCFAAGTLLMTGDGLAPIETLQVGDVVLSMDEATGTLANKRIEKVFIYEDRPYYELTVASADGTLTVVTVTDDHPVYVQGTGWVKSSELRTGDRLRAQDQSLMKVVSFVPTGKTGRTYNFSVADFHSYFANGIWVHNGDPCDITNYIEVKLKYKEGWSEAQKAAARQKVDALNSGEMVVTKSERAGASASARYKSAGGSVPDNHDVDHVRDLQLGGADDVSNMSPLDKSVNRSLGPQIYHQTKNLAPGTKVDRVTIGD